MAVDVTWLGHSTVTVDVRTPRGPLRVVTDPVLRPGLAHLRRRPRTPAPAASAGCDLALVSHLHHDHLDLPSLRRLRPGRPRHPARVLGLGALAPAPVRHPGRRGRGRADPGAARARPAGRRHRAPGPPRRSPHGQRGQPRPARRRRRRAPRPGARGVPRPRAGRPAAVGDRRHRRVRGVRRGPRCGWARARPRARARGGMGTHPGPPPPRPAAGGRAGRPDAAGAQPARALGDPAPDRPGPDHGGPLHRARSRLRRPHPPPGRPGCPGRRDRGRLRLDDAGERLP